jgi:hypothetical protein
VVRDAGSPLGPRGTTSKRDIGRLVITGSAVDVAEQVCMARVLVDQVERLPPLRCPRGRPRVPLGRGESAPSHRRTPPQRWVPIGRVADPVVDLAASDLLVAGDEEGVVASREICQESVADDVVGVNAPMRAVPSL